MPQAERARGFLQQLDVNVLTPAERSLLVQLAAKIGKRVQSVDKAAAGGGGGLGATTAVAR